MLRSASLRPSSSSSARVMPSASAGAPPALVLTMKDRTKWILMFSLLFKPFSSYCYTILQAQALPEPAPGDECS